MSRMESVLGGERFNQEAQDKLKVLFIRFKAKFLKSKVSWDRFKCIHEDWLNNTENLFVNLGGRPLGDILNQSGRTKARRTEQIRAGNTIEELAAALEVELRRRGNYIAANIVLDIGKNPRARMYSKSRGRGQVVRRD